MESFGKMIPPAAHVIRDKIERDLDVSKLVVGDIVNIIGGDIVPADLRIIQSENLKV